MSIEDEIREIIAEQFDRDKVNIGAWIAKKRISKGLTNAQIVKGVDRTKAWLMNLHQDNQSAPPEILLLLFKNMGLSKEEVREGILLSLKCRKTVPIEYIPVDMREKVLQEIADRIVEDQ